MSRDPPSPDGLAPRPASSPSKSGKTTSKEHIPSWTIAQEAELRAIFENDMLDDSECLGRLRHKGSAKSKAILEGDDETTSDDEFGQRVPSKKSSNTLRAVARKLKQHLSLESGLNKRHSRTSVGTSDEEVQRRAELKKIRQRRIQEELSNESIYDDDANSLPSIANASTHLDKKKSSSWVPGSFVPLPALGLPTLPYPTLKLPEWTPLEM